jgi:hypothetical protein
MKAIDWKNSLMSIDIPDDTEIQFIDQLTGERVDGLEINFCFVKPDVLEVILVPYDTNEPVKN